MQKFFKFLFSREQIWFSKFSFFTLIISPLYMTTHFFTIFTKFLIFVTFILVRVNENFVFCFGFLPIYDLCKFCKKIKKFHIFCEIFFTFFHFVGMRCNVKNDNFENQICFRENENLKNFCIFLSNFLQKNVLFSLTLG